MEEKTAVSAERDVMVENVSSTTEYSSQRTPEMQQEAKMCQPKEKRTLEVLNALSKKLRERNMTSRKSFTEFKHKSFESRTSSGKEESFRREHCGSESASVQKLGLKDNTNEDFEREAKRMEPEVSSSSLVLAARKHAVPISQRLSYQPGDVRLSKAHKLAPTSRNKNEREQEYPKEKFVNKRYDSASHHSKMDTSINYEEIVEREVRKIRKNMEKVNKKTSELEEGSMSKLVHSELRYEDEEGLRKDHEDQDALIPFLPSSRCCTPPPRPPVTKYWSDADETEDESDIEKHNMHINSINIVLNYLKAHSEQYYRKGREPDNDDERVQPGRKYKGQLSMALSDLQWNSSKGKFVRKQRKSNRGRNLHSRHLSNQQHAGSSGQEVESSIRDYDCHSSPQSGVGLGAVNVKLLASLSLKYLLSKSSSTNAQHEGGRFLSPSPDHYRSHSPSDSQETRTTQHRSLYDPLRHEDGRNRHVHSGQDDGESHLPWHKRRSLTTRESTSPFGHSDLLKNSRSLSPSRYRDESVRENELFPSSRYRYDSWRDKESHSPPSDRCNSPWAKQSYSPSRDRNDSLRDRVSHSPSRYRHDSLRNKGSYSPSRYRGDSLRDRESYSPSRNRGNSLRDRESFSPSRYRRDSLRDRESFSPSRYRRDSLRDRESRSPSRNRGNSLRERESRSPSRYRGNSLRDRESYSPSRNRGNSWRDRVSHSPSRYKHDSMKDRTPRSPSRHRGDSCRERRLQEEGSLRRAETPALRNTEFSSTSQRSSFQRPLEHHPLGTQLQETLFSKGLIQIDQSKSLSFRDNSRSPLRPHSRHSDLDFKRQRSRSSEKDVSPRRYKSIKHDGNRSSLELSKRSQSPRNVERLSRSDRSQSVASNTERQEEKKKNIRNDYFFNPALENTYEEYQHNSGPYIPQDQVREGERHLTEGRSLSSNSVDMLAHDSLNDRSYMHHNKIKHQSYDSNKRGNFTPKTQTQIIRFDDTNTDHPKDCFRVSSTGSAYQQPSCVPDVYDKQLQRNTSEPLATQENLPGPSGISNITFMGRKDMDDFPDWLNEDSDINYDLEDLNGPLSEVSSLIADHKAATADKTYSDAGSASAEPMEQRTVTTGNDKLGIENASLGLNPAEMNTFLRLIEIAKEHSATGKNLATNLPNILEKICQSTTTSKNVSEDDKGVAPLSNEKKYHLPKDKASGSNTFKKLSEIKEGCKLQQNKSILQRGEPYKPPGCKELSKNISKSQQRKGKFQAEKVINKSSKREETNIQSMKKGKCGGSQQKRDNIKEQSLKKKVGVKEIPRKPKPAFKTQERREIIVSKKSEIEKTFANMQHVRICIEDISQSGTRKPYKGGRATLLANPKTTPSNQVEEKPLSLDNSDSKVDSESPEEKEAKDAPDGSPQVHPLHRETIVLEHSVNICFACKHKLVPDEFTSISLRTGTVTMRCRKCHTFTKMKAVLQNDITKVSDAQKSNLLKKSCDKISSFTSGTSLKTNSNFGSEASVMKHGQYEEKNKLGRSSISNTQTMKGGHILQSVKGKLPQSVGGKVASKNTSFSRISQENQDSKYKKSMESRQESSNDTSSVDPSLLVFPWSSNRKSKKIHGDIKLNDSLSDSDEEHVTKKQRQKRPAKKRRRILSYPSSESSDD